MTWMTLDDLDDLDEDLRDADEEQWAGGATVIDRETRRRRRAAAAWDDAPGGALDGEVVGPHGATVRRGRRARSSCRRSRWRPGVRSCRASWAASTGRRVPALVGPLRDVDLPRRPDRLALPGSVPLSLPARPGRRCWRCSSARTCAQPPPRSRPASARPAAADAARAPLDGVAGGRRWRAPRAGRESALSRSSRDVHAARRRSAPHGGRLDEPGRAAGVAGLAGVGRGYRAAPCPVAPREVCRLTPAAHAAPLLRCSSPYAWWCGDGARAGVAVDRALELEPDHRLTRLIRQSLDHGSASARGAGSPHADLAGRPRRVHVVERRSSAWAVSRMVVGRS